MWDNMSIITSSFYIKDTFTTLTDSYTQCFMHFSFLTQKVYFFVIFLENTIEENQCNFLCAS